MKGGCCAACDKPWKDGITYFVLGFNFEDTFIEPQFLLRHMAHWKAKDEWFNREELECKLKEMWHGAQFRKLSYFWDKHKETMLPCICPHCNSVIPADLIESQSIDDMQPHRVTCPMCYSDVDIVPKMMVDAL